MATKFKDTLMDYTTEVLIGVAAFAISLNIAIWWPKSDLPFNY